MEIKKCLVDLQISLQNKIRTKAFENKVKNFTQGGKLH